MNIVLIGMPGCGKSTIGVLLAKAMLFHFIDTDLLIQSKYGKSLCEIIDEYGLEQFKKIENDVLCEMTFDNSVIATGGSAVYGDRAMNALRKNGKTVYLKLSPEEIEHRIKNIKTRGIAMKDGCTIADLYAERAPLYERYADITVDCANLEVEECVQAVLDSILRED